MNTFLKYPHYLKKTFFFSAILIFIFAFTLPLNPPVGNWNQQFLPSGLPNFQLSDIYFLDSLTGFAVTGNSSPNDSSGYILKTTNSGDNWVLKFAEYRDFSRVKFINNNTGFVSGGYFNGARIYKTTNSGENWYPLNIPGGGQIYFDDMVVLNEDTLWIVASNSLVGGLFRTTNGGVSWTQQLNYGSFNPERIYMYNARLGFITDGSSYVNRTTDGGFNWTTVLTNDKFTDIHFVDSLTGWKCSVSGMKKTTNGGLNWVTQTLPSGGIIQTNGISNFSIINKDTIWGSGGYVLFPNNQVRTFLNRTTNGGQNWLFQIPDTSISTGFYRYIEFTNKLIGWAYTIATGIHTTTGGDTTFYTGIIKTNDISTKQFELKQNYPNPFNPRTVIKYYIFKNGYINLIVYDITGKSIIDLVNRRQTGGSYEVDFSSIGLASGIYFYSLIINNKLIDTKKAVLIK